MLLASSVGVSAGRCPEQTPGCGDVLVLVMWKDMLDGMMAERQ